MMPFQEFMRLQESALAESPRSGIELCPTTPEEFEKEWLTGKKDDQYFYHVTLRRNVKPILRFGLAPRKNGTMSNGFYRDYSNGKVFFSERGGVPYWLSAVERHLQHQTDDQTPKLAVVRFPKSIVKDVQADTVGSKDSMHKAYYTTKPIRTIP